MKCLALIPWLLAAILVAPALADAADPRPHPDVLLFLQAASADRATARSALKELAPLWRDGYTPLVIDLVRLMRPARARGPSADPFAAGADTGFAGPASGDSGSPIRRRLIRFLEQQTGQRHGDNLDAWRRWMWSLPYEPHPDYAAFKGGVYGNIDPRMRAFFPAGVQATVRLDQVDWGGVPVNGIPLLDHPRTVQADEAGWLKDKHTVFGVVVNGEARAYPQRILAWHELARDRIGGVELAIVYCTLCNAVIPYEAEVAGRRYSFGTSGLLYKSNKLMFDEETGSLWSSVYGRPVVGPLAGSDVRLVRRPVVTTTWGEWRAAHPDTRVLSIETGHERDYREGAAYRDYFSSDDTMFAVDRYDDRLDLKDEVLVLPVVAGRGRAANPPLAISVELLTRRRVLQAEHDGESLVVLTSPRGANRVYLAGDDRFTRWIDDGHVEDENGESWQVTEEALIPQTTGAQPHPRLPAHRTYWFAWYAQHPETRLIRK